MDGGWKEIEGKMEGEGLEKGWGDGEHEVRQGCGDLLFNL